MHRAQRLMRALGALAFFYMLYGFAGQPAYADVSAALGMKVGSIGPTRARCLAKLRVLLTSEEPPRPDRRSV